MNVVNFVNYRLLIYEHAMYHEQRNHNAKAEINRARDAAHGEEYRTKKTNGILKSVVHSQCIKIRFTKICEITYVRHNICSHPLLQIIYIVDLAGLLWSLCNIHNTQCRNNK